MNKYKVICLDLDGTLLDTTRGVLHAVRRTIDELMLEALDEEVLTSFVGPPMQLSFENHYGMSKEDALDAANLFRSIYKKESLFMADLYPGVMETLVRLKGAGYRLIVATNKSHENAIQILNHFGILELCDCAMGSDLGGKLSKADIIRKCLISIDATPADCVYIGDSIFDYEGAKALNMDFIGVTYGFGFKLNDAFLWDNGVIEVNMFSEIIEVLL